MKNNKCDMCGGDIIIQPGATYGICDYYGSKVDLNITWQEREDILKEAIQKIEIKKLNEKKKQLKRKSMSWYEKAKERKFKLIIIKRWKQNVKNS